MLNNLLLTLRTLPGDFQPHQKMSVRIDGTIYIDPLPLVLRPILQYFLGGRSRYVLVSRLFTLLDQIRAFQNDLILIVVPHREHYLRTHRLLSSIDLYLVNLQFVLDTLPRLYLLLHRLQSSYRPHLPLLSALQDIERQTRDVQSSLYRIHLSFQL